MRKSLCILVSALFAFIGCSEQVDVASDEAARRDSAALHAALMPVSACIPFYYAQRTGIYDSLGLDLRILTLQAQLDTDTALQRRRADVAFSDLARAIMMQQDTTHLRAIAAADIPLTLVTARRGRVRELRQLRERMVAVARHSVTDYWSDRLTDTARLARADIFRPQINDVRIRTDMLCNGTMDAAFLPEPYAGEALLRGARQQFTTRGLAPVLVAYVATEEALADTTRRRQLRLLFEGYHIAARRLNGGSHRDSVAALYRSLCLTPDSIIDSLAAHQPHYPTLATPRRSDAQAALSWLQSRQQVRNGYTADSLIQEIPL